MSDLISRADAIERCESEAIDCTDFILWLAGVVLDDKDWWLNAMTYRIFIARWFKKLGMLELKDGHYIRPLADAEPSLKAIKRQIDEHWYLDPPSAEAKGDLISRQWLLDLYETPKDGDDVEWKVPLEVVRQNILDAPSAETVQGWIPCSERLPLVSGEFLVTLVDNDGAWVSTAQWNMTFGGRWQDIFPNDGYRDISNVIAWKALPMPYTKGENDEE